MAAHVMWAEKYRPKTLNEIVGNEEAKVRFNSWFRNWKVGDRAALLYGPPGVGKTTLVQVTAKVYSYDLVEMNASDTRTKEKIERVAGHTTSEASMQGFLQASKGTMLLLDEVDGIHGTEDRGGLAAITRLLKESKIPVALVANDISDLRLREMRDECVNIRFYPVRPPVLLTYLDHICSEESITPPEGMLKLIVSRVQGDVRSAVNDLQSVAERVRRGEEVGVEMLSLRNKQTSITATLQGIFLAENPLDARKFLYDTSVDYDMVHLMIHENLPHQYRDAGEVASGYDALSKADVFFGRVKRSQNWDLLTYGLEEMSIGVAAARVKEYPPAQYRLLPSRILMLSRTKTTRRIREALCGAVGDRCHVSRRRANAEILPFIVEMFRNDEEAMSEFTSWLNLDKDMVDYLSGKVPTKPAVRRGRVKSVKKRGAG
jgi:replication factor C large subunit